MAQQANEALIDVVEACYRLEVSDHDWLKGITAAASRLLVEGLVAAYVFDVRDPRSLQMLDACFPEEIDLEAMRGYLGSVPTAYVEKTWLAAPCSYASEFEGFEQLAPGLLSFGGTRDVIAVAGRDPTGLGVWLGAMLPKLATPSDTEKTTLARVGAHLATSYRLRRKLAGAAASPDRADAVLDPDGRLVAAQPEAADADARAALREATIAFSRARSAAGRAEPEQAIARWQAMVDGRWSLLDHFDSDGRHFVVAERNDAHVEGARELTPRELQIVSYAALGHDNKVIAYELGISHSTVRVLIHRAATKLGVSGRDALLAAFRARDACSAG